MKVKIIATNVIEEMVDEDYVPEEIEIKYIPEETLLLECRNIIGAPVSGITFEKYYNTGTFRFYNNKLPYIIRNNGNIEFGVDIDEILLSEFMKTHKIEDNIIELEYGYPQAGGPDILDWITVWNFVWNSIVTIGEIGGFVTFIDFIKQKFSKGKPLPHEIVDILYRRNLWNHHEVANKMQITEEQAKELLKFFGYSWNNSMKIYVITEEEKQNKINILDKIKFLNE